MYINITARKKRRQGTLKNGHLRGEAKSTGDSEVYPYTNAKEIYKSWKYKKMVKSSKLRSRSIMYS